MVFAVSTAVVRGEPGEPYVGSALEVLNFNGGSNYASPGADCFQVKNAGLEQLNGEPLPFQDRHEQPAHFSDALFKQEDVRAEATYSLKPTLTEKTAATSWRRTDRDADADTETQDHDGKFIDEDEEIVFRGRGMMRDPLASHDIAVDGDEDDEEDAEDGGVPLDLESGPYSSYYDSEDEDAGLEYCTPVEPREFL